MTFNKAIQSIKNYFNLQSGNQPQPAVEKAPARDARSVGQRVIDYFDLRKP